MHHFSELHDHLLELEQAEEVVTRVQDRKVFRLRNNVVREEQGRVLGVLHFQVLQLINLDPVDLHSLLTSPAVDPLVLVFPESIDRLWITIGPALATLIIGEIAIRTTDGDIEDQVELLVEGCVVAASLPRILRDILPESLVFVPQIVDVCVEDSLAIDVTLDSV